MTAAFFDRTYDEAMKLLVEVRDYVVSNQMLLRREADQIVRAVWTHEALLMTTRLSQVLAWTLVQRAVNAGEMTRENARAEEHRLGARELCLRDDPESLEVLPPYMRSLVERSRALYVRAARLDDMLGAA